MTKEMPANPVKEGILQWANKFSLRTGADAKSKLGVANSAKEGILRWAIDFSLKNRKRKPTVQTWYSEFSKGRYVPMGN